MIEIGCLMPTLILAIRVNSLSNCIRSCGQTVVFVGDIVAYMSASRLGGWYSHNVTTFSPALRSSGQASS
jgi:hypothetical protein